MSGIGFDGRALASPAAGVRRYTWELFGALARRGTPRIVAVGVPDGVAAPPGVVRAGSGWSLPTNAGWMLTGLPRAARRAHVDLFHAPSYTAPFDGPRPLVLTIHDVSYDRYPEWYPWRRDPLRRAFYRRSALSADRIITDSSFSRDEIVAAYDIPPDRVDVVPLAAAAAFRTGPRLPLPPGIPDRYLLHVGDVHVRRNLRVVIDALARAGPAGRTGVDVALVLAGVDRGESASLAAHAARHGVAAPRLIAAGPVNEPSLVALYRSARALVYPSRYEGFGLPLLEAMACGTPVLASRSSSIPEVVDDAAVLLDPDDVPGWSDAIARVLEDDAHAAALREAGIGRAALFSWARTAEQTAAVYDRLLGGRM